MKTPNYGFRVMWSAEDEGYIATTPEFEGVSGYGDSPEEALAQARDALVLAIETRRAERSPLPPAAALQAHSGQFRLRVPRSLHAQLAQAAEDEGVSLNTYAVALLARGAVAHPRQQRPARPTPTPPSTVRARGSRGSRTPPSR